MQVQVQVQVHPLPNKATGRSEQGIASPDVRVGLACGWAGGRFDIVSLLDCSSQSQGNLLFSYHPNKATFLGKLGEVIALTIAQFPSHTTKLHDVTMLQVGL